MRTLLFLLTITFLCTPAKGQMYERYKKYEQMLKQREKAGNYARQSYENYNKSRTYSYKVYQPGNTEKERNANLKKAQSYYEKAQKQADQAIKAFNKAQQYRWQLQQPTPRPKPKVIKQEQPQRIQFRNPYQSYPVYNTYQYPQGQYYPSSGKDELAGCRTVYD